MPADHPDDDAIAEALADAWIARAASDPTLRRLALRAAGLRKAPADMTRSELAQEHGVSVRTLRQDESNALHKLKLHPLSILALAAYRNRQP